MVQKNQKPMAAVAGLVIVLIFGVLMWVRNSQSQNLLIGKWQDAKANYKTMELLADGTYRTKTVSPTNNLTTSKVGTYKIIDGTHAVLIVKLRDTDTQPT